VKYLSSSKNPEIKRLRLLFEKSRERKKQGLFVIEGQRELEKAVAANYTLTSLFIEENSEFDPLIQKFPEIDKFWVSSSVFEQISYRSGSEKIIAVAASKTHHLQNLNLKANALILVIEAPEKPGNIGALYRTAAAANFDGVIIANPKTDFYNPNSIRSSLGCLFLLPTAIATSEEAVAFLTEKEFFIATAALQPEALAYDQFDYKTPCALVMGAESTGLDKTWLEASHQHLVIPMSSAVDSLNLSVSAGILMYQARSTLNNQKKQQNL
jgi:TrmH family RNA methyltransferase